MLLEEIKQKCYQLFAKEFKEEEFNWIFERAFCGEYVYEDGTPIMIPSPEEIPLSIKCAVLDFMALEAKRKIKYDFIFSKEFQKKLEQACEDLKKVSQKKYHEEVKQYFLKNPSNQLNSLLNTRL